MVDAWNRKLSVRKHCSLYAKRHSNRSCVAWKGDLQSIRCGASRVDRRHHARRTLFLCAVRCSSCPSCLNIWMIMHLGIADTHCAPNLLRLRCGIDNATISMQKLMLHSSVRQQPNANANQGARYCAYDDRLNLVRRRHCVRL
jgi:hypothetical protein